jgi:hypothetical protein
MAAYRRAVGTPPAAGPSYAPKLVDVPRPAQGGPPPDPRDHVPEKPDGYRLTDLQSLGGTESWSASDVQGFRQVAHAQQLTHKQADGLLRWGAFVGPQIARDGTEALTDQFWTAFGHQARALGLSHEQAEAVSALLHGWAERSDAQRQPPRRRGDTDTLDFAPGHVRR